MVPLAPDAVQVSADVSFSVELPGERAMTGRLTGHGSRLEVRVDEVAMTPGSGGAGELRRMASAIAAWGLTVVVVVGDVVLLEIGRTEAPWWQRPITRSPHLRVVSVRAALAEVAGRAVPPGIRALGPFSTARTGAS